MLAALRWRARPVALRGRRAPLAVAAVVVIAAPSQLGFDRDANDTTSGRWRLIKGGVELAADRPVAGLGLGLVPARVPAAGEGVRPARDGGVAHDPGHGRSPSRASSGLAVYLALLAAALALLLRARAGARPARAGIAAAFVALVAHTLMYAAFLEDPLTWTLLGAGAALAGEDP